MKRLNLEAFKAQKLDKTAVKATDKLLGQTLGDCHDESPKNVGVTVTITNSRRKKQLIKNETLKLRNF